MTKSLQISYLFALLIVLSNPAAALEEVPAEPVETKSAEHDLGYFFGYNLGNTLKQAGTEEVDPDGILEGLRDSLARKVPALSPEQQAAVISFIRASQERLEQQQLIAAQEQAEKNLQASNRFMADNGIKPGIKSTPSGLQYQILAPGTGESPTASNSVLVDYVGTLTNGTEFDTTAVRGPAELSLQQVIPGWTEGLQLMRVGGKARLFVPPDLGYGMRETGKIPSNSVLIFDIELIEIR